ncbi:hypothetical protein G5C60_15765 [Streptomyces sp. HC44]|uniref:Uncharacterized protein n=1 Tax=Streptomyces scabichelini TaxID=2711217 RepID=A0A6G4V4K1_9ACTN|nr:hypothetical protein [Streptomyces scabichelini]NGO09018.1 hypothetical protein [Streptomyces scabichelini]
MTGYSDTYIPSSITSTIHIASDVKEEDGFLSGISTINALTMALVAILVVILIAELIWRERRQRRREEPVGSVPETDPHEGDISP